MKRLCVFCGSREGSRPVYRVATQQLGTLLCERGIGLVYGGGRIGLMGLLADAVLAKGGEVIGVIPDFLAGPEVAHGGLTDLRVVQTMHERKAMMAELADGFIALPGGYGTLEEFFEILTWAQLGLHRKPCALLNIGGYYDPLLHVVANALAEDFIRTRHRGLILDGSDPARLLDDMARYAAPSLEPILHSDQV
jgi:uncharacterized protein (TIGR00730 family)